eukprot:5529998-Pleurochrysis_carterae.AAC.1
MLRTIASVHPRRCCLLCCAHIVALAAASTTAASRRFVARAALHVSLIMSDPRSRSSVSALGCGPVHAAS